MRHVIDERNARIDYTDNAKAYLETKNYLIENIYI